MFIYCRESEHFLVFNTCRRRVVAKFQLIKNLVAIVK